MTSRKDETTTEQTGSTTGYTKPATTEPKPAGQSTEVNTRCTETWEEALELGFFGEANEEPDLVFPGPQPEAPEEPDTPEEPDVPERTSKRKG